MHGSISDNQYQVRQLDSTTVATIQEVVKTWRIFQENWESAAPGDSGRREMKNERLLRQGDAPGAAAPPGTCAKGDARKSRGGRSHDQSLVLQRWRHWHWSSDLNRCTIRYDNKSRTSSQTKKIRQEKRFNGGTSDAVQHRRSRFSGLFLLDHFRRGHLVRMETEQEDCQRHGEYHSGRQGYWTLHWRSHHDRWILYSVFFVANTLTQFQRQQRQLEKKHWFILFF